MKKPFTALLAVAAGLVALAEPCVLEKGYKPQAKQSVDEVVSLLGELSLDTPAEQPAEPVAPQVEQPQAVTPAPEAEPPQAAEQPAEPVAPQVEQPQAVATEPQVEPPVSQAAVETETPTVPADTSVTNAESQVEEPLPKKTKEKKLTGRPAKITSDTTVYNRKEGIASFEGHVHVDDEQYQMHADRVFLFFDIDKDSNSTNAVRRSKGTNDVHRVAKGTNDVHKAAKGTGDMRRAAGDVRRIVAIGHVAMTNDAHRAYGAKATYSKKNGLVVLYSGDGITAEVRDESKAQPQIVRGKRIRFWIDSEQVEVDEADLTGAAPSGGASTLKKALGK